MGVASSFTKIVGIINTLTPEVASNKLLLKAEIVEITGLVGRNCCLSSLWITANAFQCPLKRGAVGCEYTIPYSRGGSGESVLLLIRVAALTKRSSMQWPPTTRRPPPILSSATVANR